MHASESTESLNPSSIYLKLHEYRRHTISEVTREQIFASHWPRVPPSELTQIEPDLQSGQITPHRKDDERPFHVFSRRRKLFLIYLISFAGFFSPFSSNIYFPAIGQISKVYNQRIAVDSSLIPDLGTQRIGVVGSVDHYQLHDCSRPGAIVLGSALGLSWATSDSDCNSPGLPCRQHCIRSF
jgi:hypothetical protein